MPLRPDLSAVLPLDDTAATPGNKLSSAFAFLFIADETPLHRKLGVFETRD